MLLKAQTLSSGGTYSWTQPSTWGLTSGFPGSTVESATSAIVRINTGLQPVTLTNAAPPFPISTLILERPIPSTTGINTAITNAIVRLLPQSTSLATITIGNIRFQTSGTTLIIGTGLRLVLQGSVFTPPSDSLIPPTRILIERNAVLELTLSTNTTLSFVQIQGTDETSHIFLRANGNRLVLPTARFSPSTQITLQARLILGGTFTLDNTLRIAQNGVFDFGSGTNKLILGTSNIVCLGSVANAGAERYFVTNSTGSVRLGNVGNITFHLGTRETLYTPLNIVNNAAPSEFSVRAVNPIQVTVPTAASRTNVLLASVGTNWIVSQHTNVSQGVAVFLNPQWHSSQESSGFNRSIASVGRINSSGQITQSSAAAPAAPVQGLTNYFSSSLVVTQTAAPGVLSNTPILVTSQPQPSILSYTPAQYASSQTVTIVGQHFAAVTAVLFGGVPATSFTVSAGGDTIRAIVGQGASGNITVRQEGGIAQISGSFSPTGGGTFQQQPIIATVTPSTLQAGLGDLPLTLRGSGFGSNTVRVNVTGSGLTGLTIPTFTSSTQVSIIVPGQFTRNIGSIRLEVTSLDKFPVSTNISIVAAMPPQITLLQPSTTTASNRAFTLRVEGRNVGLQSSFTLNNTLLRLMNAQVSSDGTWTMFVEIPANAESGELRITNLNIQSTSANLVITPRTGILRAEEVFSEMSIAPNPVSDNLSIYGILRETGRVQLRIVDMRGNVAFQEEWFAEKGTMSKILDVKNLSKGAYLLELRALYSTHFLRGKALKFAK